MNKQQRIEEQKRRKIEDTLTMIDKSLAAAEHYVTQKVNVESSSNLHLNDWNGRSGHPLWMKNFMIPTTKRYKARLEKALEGISSKSEERSLKQQRRSSNHS